MEALNSDKERRLFFDFIDGHGIHKDQRFTKQMIVFLKLDLQLWKRVFQRLCLLLVSSSALPRNALAFAACFASSNAVACFSARPPK